MTGLVSVGDRVRNGTYRLHSRFRRAANFTAGRWLVTVADETVGPGPVNLVVRGVDLAGVDEVRVASGWVRIGTRRFRRGRRLRYRSDVKVRCRARTRLDERLREMQEVLMKRAHPRSLVFLLRGRSVAAFSAGFERRLARRLAAGAARMQAGALAAGARLLAGCGWGRTPAGDDFLAGFMAGLQAAHRATGRRVAARLAAIRRAAPSGDLLARTFLDLACAGCFPVRLQALIRSVLGGRPAEVRAGAVGLLTIGATSGADWGVGFLAGMRLLLPRGDVP